MEGEGAGDAGYTGDQGSGSYEGSYASDPMTTVYNGSSQCPECYGLLNPVQAIYAYAGLCPSCQRKKINKRKRDRMVDDGR